MFQFFESIGAKQWDYARDMFGNSNRRPCGRTMHTKMTNHFDLGSLSVMVVFISCWVSSPFFVAFSKLEPKESAEGCWRYASVQRALQGMLDIAVQLGDPVVGDAGFADIAFGYDGGKFGGSILSASIINSKNDLGSKDVRCCNVLGIGDAADTRAALVTNFPEVIEFINEGSFSSSIIVISVADVSL